MLGGRMKITRKALRKIIIEQLTLNLKDNTSWEGWVRELAEDDDYDDEEKDDDEDSKSK